MNASHPKPPNTTKSRDFVILLIVLSVVAGFYAWKQKQVPRVTVSGLSLFLTVDQVEEKLGKANFRTRAYGAYILEYWSQKDRPQLKVWSADNVVYKIEGGIPEIDGQNALNWDLDAIETKLGPASHGGRSGEVGGTGHSFLAYPDHRLLIQRDNAKTKFILFKSGRS